jgi:hypothetical protein
MCLTHGNLLHGEPAPFCINCGVPLTVAQILVDCPHYGEARHIYLHSAPSDILGDDCCSVFNGIAFINAVWLATSLNGHGVIFFLEFLFLHFSEVT